LDTPYVLGSLREGLVGIVLLLIPIPFLLDVVKPGRYFALVAPAVAATMLFVVSCVCSTWTTHKTTDVIIGVHMVAMILAMGLIVPSVAALETKSRGVFHLSTVAGTMYLWFISGMALSHDWL
jgi:hypothetical protein